MQKANQGTFENSTGFLYMTKQTAFNIDLVN